MVIRVLGSAGGDEPIGRNCAAGHGMTAVVRAGRVRLVCLECLGAALGGAAARREGVTVNDFLASLDGGGGDHPRLPARDAEAGAALLQAARELHGDPDGACARKVVRDVARALDRPAKEIMQWRLRRLVNEGLPALTPV